MDAPECDRMLAVHDKSQAIGEFLTWLSDKGYIICTLGYEMVEDGTRSHCRECHRRVHFESDTIDREAGHLGWVHSAGDEFDHEAEPEDRSVILWPEFMGDSWINRHLAQFFDIDLDKVEAEKLAILEELRNANNANATPNTLIYINTTGEVITDSPLPNHKEH